MERETKDSIVTFRNKYTSTYRVGTLTEVQNDFGLYFTKPRCCCNYKLSVNHVLYNEFIGYSTTSAPTIEYLELPPLVIDCVPRGLLWMPDFSKYLLKNADKCEWEDVADERGNNERIIKHSELHSRV